MRLTFNIKNSSIEDTRKIIEQLNSRGIFDWDYFWRNSDLDDYFEYLAGAFVELVNWNLVSENEQIQWTDKRVELFSDKVNFKLLSKNKNIACSTYIIEKYKAKWCWCGDKSGDKRGKRVWYNIGGLSANPNLPLDLCFLKDMEQYLDFRSLGQNPSLFFQDMRTWHPEIKYEFKDQFDKTFKILSEFESKWCMKGSYWDDGNFSGYAKDSIFDNPKIDWHYYQKYKNSLNNNESDLSNASDDLPF